MRVGSVSGQACLRRDSGEKKGRSISSACERMENVIAVCMVCEMCACLLHAVTACPEVHAAASVIVDESVGCVGLEDAGE
jgi:hypothetical protein